MVLAAVRITRPLAFEGGRLIREFDRPRILSRDFSRDILLIISPSNVNTVNPIVIFFDFSRSRDILLIISRSNINIINPIDIIFFSIFFSREKSLAR